MNVVLTGFMGTGKSTVGRMLAKRLGLKLLDTDSLIETEAGISVADIFAKHGEAHFRKLESSVVKRLASGVFGSNAVVSTGGGIVISEENRRALRGWGKVVLLKANVDAILERVGDRSDRPLLVGADRREKIERLLGERRAFYEDCDLAIDTTGAQVSVVVERIAGFLLSENAK